MASGSGIMWWQPGCPCCCDCEEFEETLDDISDCEQVEGTWTAMWGVAWPTSAPAMLIGYEEASSINMAVAQNVLPLRSQAGDCGTVICYADEDNYVYVWGKNETGTAFGPFSYGVTEVIGGVANVLAYYNGVGSVRPTGFCCLQNNGTVLVKFRFNSGDPAYVRVELTSTSGLGKRVGVRSTFVMNGPAGQYFTGWEVEKSGPACENCWCNAFELFTWPEQFLVTISGVVCGGVEVVDGSYVFDPDIDDKCTFRSDAFPRLFTIDFAALTADTMGVNFFVRGSGGVNHYYSTTLPARCRRINGLSSLATPMEIDLSFVTSDSCDWSNATATVELA